MAVKMTDIYFRTDGNSKIATGHLMRCLAIARACTRQGANVKFIVSDEESLTLLQERFEIPQEFDCYCLNTNYEELHSEIPVLFSFLSADSGLSITASHARPWIFIDSYYASTPYFKALREYFRVAYLDDLRSFDCAVDLLINYDTDEDCGCYASASRKLLGAQYTPLREQFQAPSYKVRPRVEHILLSTGGTDPYRVAETLLGSIYNTPAMGDALSDGLILPDSAALLGSDTLLDNDALLDSAALLDNDTLPDGIALSDSNIPTDGLTNSHAQPRTQDIQHPLYPMEDIHALRSRQYHILTSRANTRYGALNALAQAHPSIHIHTNVTDVAALMASCDLAVCAGGTTLCELCAVGVPSVSYLMAENQRTAVETYARMNLIPCAGDIRPVNPAPGSDCSRALHTDPIPVSSSASEHMSSCMPNAATLRHILAFLLTMAKDYDARASASSSMRSFLDGTGAVQIAWALLL